MRKSIPIIALLALAIGFFAYKKRQSKPKGEEKVLHISSTCMPTTLDPSLSSHDLYAALETYKVYEGLLEYHYLKRPAELIPNLAEAMPEISEDGLTYTFRIKQGIYFQDNKCFANEKGRELVAQDFVYSIMRSADPKLQVPTYAMLDGKILGLSEWREKYKDSPETNFNEEIEGIKAIDKYTLQIKLSKPWPQFLHILTMPLMMAVPKEAVDFYGKEFGNHPVGTGPFIIKNFNTQENKIIAYKNPTYRVKYYPTEASEECKHLLLKEEKRLPFVDRVETYVLAEEQPRWLQFISKKLDMLSLYKMSDLDKKVIDGEPADEYKNQGILLMIAPTSCTGMYVMNNDVAPFKNNIYLRQAISMAYDRAKENELFNSNTHIVAQSIIPPTLAGFEKDFVNVNNTYNVEEAKKLMIKAGYPEGKGLEPIVLEITAATRVRQSAEFLQSCLAQIGVKLIISTNSWPELMNKAHSGKAQMHATGWLADYPDAENFLYLFRHRDPAHGKYANPEYDKLYDKASIMNDSLERTKLYEHMNRILAHEVPVLFITHDTHMEFYYSWVLNFQYFDAKRQDIIQYLDIDLEKKKEILGKK